MLFNYLNCKNSDITKRLGYGQFQLVLKVRMREPRHAFCFRRKVWQKKKAGILKLFSDVSRIFKPRTRTHSSDDLELVII